MSQNDQFSQATDFFYNLLNDLSDDVCTFGDLKIEDMLFLFGMLQDVQINLPPLLIIVLLHPILALWNMLIRFILNYIYNSVIRKAQQLYNEKSLLQALSNMVHS